jgi:NADH-quinone oxidoreductase subunit B
VPEIGRFSPRQADVLWVIGTISQRQGPVLKRIYEQMMNPKWVFAFGTCAASGGFYDNYATLPGVDKIVPVDIYLPGCPPRPEMVLDAVMLLQDKIARGDRRPGIVKPRVDPVQKVEALVNLRRSATDSTALTHAHSMRDRKVCFVTELPNALPPSAPSGTVPRQRASPSPARRL